MSDRGYIVGSVIICEDIRIEGNGKEIIIGVFNSSIIYGQFPATQSRLIFRVPVDATRRDFTRMRARIVDQNDKQLFSLDQVVNLQGPIDLEDPILFGFALNNVSFPEPGKYRVFFSLDDYEPEQIMRFSVRGPSSQEEVRKVS